jgi:penicillin amidase
MQFDSYSMLAETYVPLLAGLSSEDPVVQAAIERMRGWDHQETRDSVPAALFEIFFMELSEATLADEVGEADEFFPWNSNAQRVFFHDLANKPEARWWDKINTSQVETREEIILLAVEEAVAFLDENLGGELGDWNWGKLHTTTFEAQVLGQSGIWPIESLLNRGPYASDGGSSIVNALGWSWDDPAVVGGLPSMRMIVDLSNLEASQGVHTTGQSGHVGNRHYDDMIDLWLNGEYHTMLFGRNAVESAAEDHLILKPD